jgi:hypothetical protein
MNSKFFLYREVVITKCEGCSKIVRQQQLFNLGDAEYCSVYLSPASKWRIGNCPMATHIKREAVVDEKKINPLKQSRRSKQVMK